MTFKCAKCDKCGQVKMKKILHYQDYEDLEPTPRNEVVGCKLMGQVQYAKIKPFESRICPFEFC